jgi:hypothetical protein
MNADHLGIGATGLPIPCSPPPFECLWSHCRCDMQTQRLAKGAIELMVPHDGSSVEGCLLLMDNEPCNH